MQKIVPFLWFDNQAEEAARFYTSLFVTCAAENEVDALWAGLSEGGKALMPLQKYPFSEKFGWCADRYGMTWQLNLTGGPKEISPFLLFVGAQNGKAEEAMKFYGSLFPSSRVEHVERYGPGQPGQEGTVMHARFTLAGQQFMAMDSNLEHHFTFTPAQSLYVSCDTQKEIDALWDKLTAGGGKEVECGWVTDKYGVSWQIVPSILGELVGDGTSGRASKVMAAVLKMKKLDIRELEKAAGRK